MRISERKRQLRERAGSSDAPLHSTVARPAPSPRARKPAPAGRAQTSGARQRSTAAQPRPRRQRGPRFYAGFGIVGLFFSIYLLVATTTSYNSEHDKYPGKLKSYQTQVAAYPHALAVYNAAVKNHVKPAPVAPKKPVAPTKPQLSALSYALPGLYAILSLAYLYLAWRAANGRSFGAAARAPAR